MAWKRQRKKEMDNTEEKPNPRRFISHQIIGEPITQHYGTSTPVSQNTGGSIIPFPFPARNEPALLQQQHPNAKKGIVEKMWGPDQLIKYYDSLASDGYKVGAKIKTLYGRKGTIKSYKDPTKPVLLSQMNYPLCIRLEFEAPLHSMESNEFLLFSEDEIQLDKE